MLQKIRSRKEAMIEELLTLYNEEQLAPLLRAHDKWLKKNPDAMDEKWSKTMELEALSHLDEEEPFWTFVAARIYLSQVYSELAVIRNCSSNEVYSKFHEHINHLSEKGLYDIKLLQAYTADEISALGAILEPERDKLFTYIGLKTLMDRYVARDYDKTSAELPQERWLIIAMTLMQSETTDCLVIMGIFRFVTFY